MLQEEVLTKEVLSITKVRDLKVAKYLLNRQFPVQQVLDATNLNPTELSELIKQVRREHKKTD